MEGIAYHIDALHGVADFDNPGGTVTVAARLTTQLRSSLAATGPLKAVLVHEPDQGHFPVWFMSYLQQQLPAINPSSCTMALSGRNILALEASCHNLHGRALMVPAVDPLVNRDELLAALGDPDSGGPKGRYNMVILFPEAVPQTNRINAYWEGIGELLEPGGIALIALSATHAERFDREKPKDFSRLGDFKRHGFRALAYRKKSPQNPKP
jgi:hypothetical protein